MTITYGELDSRAGAVASRLLAAGVRRGDVVAICSPPSIDLVAGVLGTLRAGATYMLLEPDLPASRLEFVVPDSGAAAILAPPSVASRLAGLTAPVLSLAEAGDVAHQSSPGPVEPADGRSAACNT